MDPAIIIDSDDAELEDLVRRLAKRVIAAGGYLHPQLRIVAARGQLKVECSAGDAAPLVRLPESCLLTVNDVVFALDGDKLLVESCPPGYSAEKRAMLDCMVAIYNRGQKIREYRRELPWLAFASQPTLLALLHRGRAQAPKPTRLYELARNGELDRLALDGFLGSRTLNYRPADGDPQTVIMPFIDFFNHHAASPPFGRQGDALMVALSRPLTGSTECFVRYNALDTLDAYLNYGFADMSARFVRSVPVQVDLPDIGRLGIRARVAPPRKQPLAPGLADLKGFLPQFQRQAGGELAVAQLLIPLAAPPGLLHRVLGVLIQQINPAQAVSDLRGAASSAVLQVVDANQAYYRELAGALEGVRSALERTPALRQLDAAIAAQQEKLASFAGAISEEQLRRLAGPDFPYDFGQGLAWS